MRCEEFLERLDDFVDGILAPEEEERISHHAAACAACGTELAAVRRLGTRVAELPRSIEPARDLWPGVAARIESEKVVRGVFTRSTRRFLLAAAVVVAALGVLAIAHTVGRQQVPSKMVRIAPPSDLVTAANGAPSFGVAEAEFREARVELMAALELRRENLAPETLEVVEENLRVIDAAIGRISSALAEDLGNPRLTLQLASAYRHQIDLLQRASRLPAES
jgi:anti-sigma factor RsiW